MADAIATSAGKKREQRRLNMGNVRHSFKFSCIGVCCVVALVTGKTLFADDKMQLELTVVKGNRELPKVLYIVPWKRLPNNEIEQKLTLHSLFIDAFEPVEPGRFEEFVDDYRYFSSPD